MTQSTIIARRGLPFGGARAEPEAVSVLAAATELKSTGGPIAGRDRLIINPTDGDVYIATTNAVTVATGLYVAQDAWLELDCDNGAGTWWAIAAAPVDVRVYEVVD